MGAERANYACGRMLWRLDQWQHYAAEPVTDLDHATTKLRALAAVMQSMHGDIIDHWHGAMVHGAPAEAWDNDGGGAPMLDPRLAEFHVRRARGRRPADAI
jgi:hypothetical protein